MGVGGRGDAPAGEARTATLNDGRPVALAGERAVWFGAMLRYRLVAPVDGSWRVETGKYIYTFRDRDDAELLAYHRHPTGRSRVTWPHLHVGGLGSGLVQSRTHLPTGYVALQDLIRLAIEAFAVTPRRRDWASVLERTRT